MSDMKSFAAAIAARISTARQQPHWSAEEVQRYMTDFVPRRARFEPLAKRLIADVIRPRLEQVADYFSNATWAKDEPASHCACWFGYCERFPATTRVEFAVEHDARCEHVTVRFELSTAPVFVKFVGQDKLTTPLDDMRDDVVADWVEQRLLEFLDVYLQIDRGDPDADEDVATDPVCAMRISRSQAAARHDYRGHTYFFCSDECQRAFAADPTRFVSVRAS